MGVPFEDLCYAQTLLTSAMSRSTQHEHPDSSPAFPSSEVYDTSAHMACSTRSCKFSISSAPSFASLKPASRRLTRSTRFQPTQPTNVRHREWHNGAAHRVT